MRKCAAMVLIIVPLCMLMDGCAEDRSPPHPPMSVPGDPAGAGSGSSTGPSVAPAPTPDPDTDKPRGNTPVGKDRTGGGPADGAIKDPSGAATGSSEPAAR